jgi:hypothetical protein
MPSVTLHRTAAAAAAHPHFQSSQTEAAATEMPQPQAIPSIMMQLDGRNRNFKEKLFSNNLLRSMLKPNEPARERVHAQTLTRSTLTTRFAAPAGTSTSKTGLAPSLLHDFLSAAEACGEVTAVLKQEFHERFHNRSFVNDFAIVAQYPEIKYASSARYINGWRASAHRLAADNCLGPLIDRIFPEQLAAAKRVISTERHPQERLHPDSIGLLATARASTLAASAK